MGLAMHDIGTMGFWYIAPGNANDKSNLCFNFPVSSKTKAVIHSEHILQEQLKIYYSSVWGERHWASSKYPPRLML